MMNKQRSELSSRSSNSSMTSNILVWLHGVPFTLDKELLAAKSAKLAVLFRAKSDDEVCRFLKEIVTDLAISSLLQETHSAENLLGKALAFFEQRVLPSWNRTVKALHIEENVLKQAFQLGLVKTCIDSIIEKALVDPSLLGEPIRNSSCDSGSEERNENYRPMVRRKLFGPNLDSESLKTLPLPLYEPIIRAINKTELPPEYVAASLCQYVKNWVLTDITDEEDMSPCMRKFQREVIEAVERLLPNKRGLLPCTILFEFLRLAAELKASSDCRSGFEMRIGKQLEQAKVKDLRMPSQGYSKEVEYDIETVRRILKHFYSNYVSPDVSGLMKVAELVEQFLAEVSSDKDLKIDTFRLLAETSIAASSGMPRNSDGIYRAINIYLDNHRYFTEFEREEVCKVLDCNKLSIEACKHAAKNERLPMRVVVQVLFVGQLQLRDVVLNDLQDAEEESSKLDIVIDGEETRTEIDMINDKVLKLEEECFLLKKEIERSRSSTTRNEKTSIWKVMKRKFGCIGSRNDYVYKDMRNQKRKKTMNNMAFRTGH